MSDHRDNWIQTSTGRPFYPFRPEDSEIVIEDVAHALSNLCRFGGHVRQFYSVAQHCVHVSELVEPRFALRGLLHDASEAFLVDVPSPIKVALTRYRELEARVQAAVYQRFGLQGVEEPDVKDADLVLLSTEARDLMPNPAWIWSLPLPPSDTLKIDPWEPDHAKAAFLRRFAEVRIR